MGSSLCNLALDTITNIICVPKEQTIYRMRQVSLERACFHRISLSISPHQCDRQLFASVNSDYLRLIQSTTDVLDTHLRHASLGGIDPSGTWCTALSDILRQLWLRGPVQCGSASAGHVRDEEQSKTVQYWCHSQQQRAHSCLYSG